MLFIESAKYGKARKIVLHTLNWVILPEYSYAKYKNREKNVFRDIIMEQDRIDWRAQKTFL